MGKEDIVEIVRLLQEEDVNEMGEVFELLSCKKLKPIIQELIKSKKINVKTSHLLTAAAGFDLKCVKMLVDLGFTVKKNNELPALHRAIYAKRPKNTKYLVSKFGVKQINYIDFLGNTALDLAIERMGDSVAIINFLIKNGAKVNLFDIKDIARDEDLTNVLGELLKRIKL